MIPNNVAAPARPQYQQVTLNKSEMRVNDKAVVAPPVLVPPLELNVKVTNSSANQQSALKLKKLLLYYQNNRYDIRFVKRKQNMRLRYLISSRLFKSKLTRVCDSFSFNHSIDFESVESMSRAFRSHDDFSCVYSIRASHSPSRRTIAPGGRLRGLDLKEAKHKVSNMVRLTNFQVTHFK